MRRSLIGIALSLSLLGTAAARADEPAAPPAPPGQGPGEGRWGGPGGPDGGMHGMFRELNLTADQKSQLKSLREQRQAEDRAAHKDVKDAQHAFAQLLLSGNASDDAIRAAQRTLAQKREAEAQVRFEGMLQVRHILTADQRAKFDQGFIEMRREHHMRGPQ